MVHHAQIKGILTFGDLRNQSMSYIIYFIEFDIPIREKNVKPLLF